MFFEEILCWRSFYKSLRNYPNRYQRVSKKSVRNRPNSRLQFPSASFHVPEPYCRRHIQRQTSKAKCTDSTHCTQKSKKWRQNAPQKLNNQTLKNQRNGHRSKTPPLERPLARTWIHRMENQAGILVASGGKPCHKKTVSTWKRDLGGTYVGVLGAAARTGFEAKVKMWEELVFVKRVCIIRMGLSTWRLQFQVISMYSESTSVATDKTMAERWPHVALQSESSPTLFFLMKIIYSPRGVSVSSFLDVWNVSLRFTTFTPKISLFSHQTPTRITVLY